LQPVDIKSRWRHNWKSAQVVNSHLVCDPTIRQPGIDLSRQQWSLLNRFRTEQGHCGACRRKWRLTCRHWSVSVWRDPDDVSRCRILSPDKTEWRLISATLCGWRRCFVADQLWLMKRIQEKEEVQRYYVGCYIWYSEERTGRGRSPLRPLLAVPNVTVHPSTASVPITVLLYNDPLLCGLMCH